MVSTKAPLQWTTSSYSGQQGDCIQWRRSADGNGIDVRDSKSPGGPTLTVAPQAWTAFINDVVNKDQ